MPFFKISAEHITRSKGNNIIKHAEDVMHLHVLHAGKDDVFTNTFHIVVEATQSQANKLRDFVWEQNHGAWCEIVKNWHEELDADAGWL